jgi:hypothetical protein
MCRPSPSWSIFFSLRFVLIGFNICDRFLVKLLLILKTNKAAIDGKKKKMVHKTFSFPSEGFMTNYSH